jgi:asparaginyl-tRNA synthetase
MKHLRLAELLSQPEKYDTVVVRGWVRTFRANRFIALNDGSTIENLQCVVDFENTDESLLKKINSGAAVEIKGQLVESMGND